MNRPLMICRPRDPFDIQPTRKRTLPFLRKGSGCRAAVHSCGYFDVTRSSRKVWVRPRSKIASESLAVTAAQQPLHLRAKDFVVLPVLPGAPPLVPWLWTMATRELTEDDVRMFIVKMMGIEGYTLEKEGRDGFEITNKNCKSILKPTVDMLKTEVLDRHHVYQQRGITPRLAKPAAALNRNYALRQLTHVPPIDIPEEELKRMKLRLDAIRKVVNSARKSVPRKEAWTLIRDAIQNIADDTPETNNAIAVPDDTASSAVVETNVTTVNSEEQLAPNEDSGYSSALDMLATASIADSANTNSDKASASVSLFGSSGAGLLMMPENSMPSTGSVTKPNDGEESQIGSIGSSFMDKLGLKPQAVPSSIDEHVEEQDKGENESKDSTKTSATEMVERIVNGSVGESTFNLSKEFGRAQKRVRPNQQDGIVKGSGFPSSGTVGDAAGVEAHVSGGASSADTPDNNNNNDNKNKGSRNNNNDQIDKSNTSTALHWAAKDGYIESVVALLDEGLIPIDAQDENGDTPLHLATMEKLDNSDVVDLLLDRGASVKVRNNKGETALHAATSINDPDIILALIRKKADVDAEEKRGFMPLHMAATIGHDLVVRCLLENGATVDALKNLYGITALHAACHNGHLKAVMVLVEKGAKTTMKTTREGGTPLHAASLNGHIDVVRYLIEQGALVNATNNDGLTPLHASSLRGHTPVVECLLQRGATTDTKTNLGLTALHGAAKKGHTGVVECLVDNGASVTEGNSQKQSALHVASQAGHADIVKFLVERGAVVNATDTNGRTALHYASDNGNIEVIQYLVQHGGSIGAQTATWDRVGTLR